MSKKVLLVRFSSAGDILLSAQLIRQLKKRGLIVHLLTKRKFMEAALAAGADRAIVYGTGEYAGLFRAAASLTAEKYDYCIDLHATLRSRLLTLAVKAPRRAFYFKHSVKRRFMVLFKWFMQDPAETVADRYIKTAAKVIDGMAPVRRRAKPVRGGAQKIIIHMGAKWANKRWPWFDELAVLLAGLPRTIVTVTGVKDEIENYEQMRYHKNKKIRDLAGKTDFTGLIREIGKSTLFIGNDTAAAHAAVMQGIPAVVFLGPTCSGFGFITDSDFHIIEKKGLLCRPCHLHGGGKCPIGSFECMKNITAAEAFSRIKALTGRE